MFVKLMSVMTLITLTASPVVAQTDDFGLLAEVRNERAPAELSQWDNMIGDWRTTWQSIGPDGEVAATGETEWNWRWVLNGFAVQDMWINPPRDAEAPNGRLFGTNLRIFNSQTGLWEMAWANNRESKVDTYTAVFDEERIIMSPDENPDGVRIIFYDMTGETFDWVSEASADGGETWRPTFRIHGERVE